MTRKEEERNDSAEKDEEMSEEEKAKIQQKRGRMRKQVANKNESKRVRKHTLSFLRFVEGREAGVHTRSRIIIIGCCLITWNKKKMKETKISAKRLEREGRRWWRMTEVNKEKEHMKQDKRNINSKKKHKDKQENNKTKKRWGENKRRMARRGVGREFQSNRPRAESTREFLLSKAAMQSLYWVVSSKHNWTWSKLLLFKVRLPNSAVTAIGIFFYE